MMMNKKKPFSLHLDVDSFMPATAEEKEVISRMRPSSTFFRDGVKRLLKNKVATISLILIVLITLSSIIIPMFWPYSYDQMLGQTKGRPMDNSYNNLAPFQYGKTELKKIDKKERRKQIGEVMELTKITSMQDRLIQNLSKGYKQRVGLAQAILGYPKIIILDEPTVGLDPMQIIEIRQLIKSLGKKHTVILSSHILPEVSAVCDHIMIIAHGRLAASDTPENLSRLMSGDNVLSMQLCGTEDAVRAAEKELKERYAAIGEMHASYNVENDLWQMELHYKKEVDLREEIFYYMAEHRLPIYEMKMTSKSLEDVFLELTKEQEKSAAAEEMTGRTAKERAAEENSQTAETTQKEETDNAGNMEKGI